MKKLVFMFVAMTAMSFAACGGSTNAEAPAEDTAAVEAVEEAVEEVAAPADSAAVADSTVAE